MKFVLILVLTLAIIIISIEFVNLFFLRTKQKLSYIGLKDSKASYLPSYITSYFVVLIFLTISQRYSLAFYKEILFSIILVLFIKFICNLPYKYAIQNITQIINMMILLTYLGFSIYKRIVPSI